MLITLTQLKKSLQALKDFLLAKIPLKTSDLTNDSGYITADDAVQDVQIDGTSIVDNGVAVIPVVNGGGTGAVKLNAYSMYGLNTNTPDHSLGIAPPDSAKMKAGTDPYRPVVVKQQHKAVFYGLAKIAGHDEKDSTLTVGTYTAEAKSAIQTMLGVDTAISEAMSQVTVDSIPTTEIDTLFA